MDWYREFGRMIRENKTREFFRDFIYGTLKLYFENFDNINEDRAWILVELFMNKAGFSDEMFKIIEDIKKPPITEHGSFAFPQHCNPFNI